jgi:hypothetical protein
MLTTRPGHVQCAPDDGAAHIRARSCSGSGYPRACASLNPEPAQAPLPALGVPEAPGGPMADAAGEANGVAGVYSAREGAHYPGSVFYMALACMAQLDRCERALERVSEQ